MTIRPAVASDLAQVKAWLRGARLPVADLTPEHMSGFLVATLGDSPTGMIGLEQFDEIGLLRSLYVDAPARTHGVGGRLVAALEELARSRQVAELWLLTIDADRYFAGLGYERVEREMAPEAIRNTVEFAKLCPGDALLMKKRL